MNKSIDQNPIPQGKYKIASRIGNMIFTSGMTPRKDGKLLYTGKVNQDHKLDDHHNAVVLATENAINAAKSMLKDGENLIQIASLTVYINAEDNFSNHAKLADFASQYIVDNLGTNAIGCRAAIGVGSLPGNATVEIQLIAHFN